MVGGRESLWLSAAPLPAVHLLLWAETVFSTADSATSTNWSLLVPTKGRLVGTRVSLKPGRLLVF